MHKAACLAKTDLTTELVKEFTELQGIVGGLYASVQNLDHGMPDETRQAIAATIYDQYKPQSAEDSVPRKIEGAVLVHCRQSRHYRRHVRPGLAAYGIERSICAAAAGKWNCEDHCRAQVADRSWTFL